MSDAGALGGGDDAVGLLDLPVDERRDEEERIDALEGGRERLDGVEVDADVLGRANLRRRSSRAGRGLIRDLDASAWRNHRLPQRGFEGGEPLFDDGELVARGQRDNPPLLASGDRRRGSKRGSQGT